VTTVQSLAKPLLALVVLSVVATAAAMLLTGSLARAPGHLVTVPATPGKQLQVRQPNPAAAEPPSLSSPAKPAGAQTPRGGPVPSATPAALRTGGQGSPADAGPDVVGAPGGSGLKTCGPKPCPGLQP